MASLFKYQASWESTSVFERRQLIPLIANDWVHLPDFEWPLAFPSNSNQLIRFATQWTIEPSKLQWLKHRPHPRIIKWTESKDIRGDKFRPPIDEELLVRLEFYWSGRDFTPCLEEHFALSSWIQLESSITSHQVELFLKHESPTFIGALLLGFLVIELLLFLHFTDLQFFFLVEGALYHFIIDFRD